MGTDRSIGSPVLHQLPPSNWDPSRGWGAAFGTPLQLLPLREMCRRERKRTNLLQTSTGTKQINDEHHSSHHYPGLSAQHPFVWEGSIQSSAPHTLRHGTVETVPPFFWLWETFRCFLSSIHASNQRLLLQIYISWFAIFFYKFTKISLTAS